MSPLLSVVIPCFNEAGKIEKDISAALEYFSGRTYSFELILVDDGSTDGTPEILGQAKACVPVCYRPNRGKGYAVRTGMLRATGRYRLFADAGLCVPFSEIEKGLALLEAGVDVAIGSRRLSGSQIVQPQAGYRRLGSAVFGSLARLREAAVGEIEQTPGIGPEMAKTIHDALHGVRPREAKVG